MKIGIIGCGPIGQNCGWMFARAGHDVKISFSRSAEKLAAIAQQLGPTVTSGTPAEAVAFGDVVVLSVPWSLIEMALDQAGPMGGKIVIDTCNQFGRGSELIPRGMTAVRYNQNRIPGARLAKSYNTLTAGFQHRTSGLTGSERVAMFFAADDPEARQVVGQLIEDSGFVAIDVGGLDDAAPMEAPRRPGAVYGEEYHEDSAKEFLANYRK
jgi:predicted dinucleotide-binding enzyme